MSSIGALKIRLNLHKSSVGFQITYFLIRCFSISKHGCKTLYPTCECNQCKLKLLFFLFGLFSLSLSVPQFSKWTSMWGVPRLYFLLKFHALYAGAVGGGSSVPQGRWALNLFFIRPRNLILSPRNSCFIYIYIYI
jgi:hypothetical protein